MSRRNLESVADDMEQLSPGGGTFEQLQHDDFDDEDGGPTEKKVAYGGANDFWADLVCTWYRRLQ